METEGRILAERKNHDLRIEQVETELHAADLCVVVCSLHSIVAVCLTPCITCTGCWSVLLCLTSPETPSGVRRKRFQREYGKHRRLKRDRFRFLSRLYIQ